MEVSFYGISRMPRVKVAARLLSYNSFGDRWLCERCQRETGAVIQSGQYSALQKYVLVQESKAKTYNQLWINDAWRMLLLSFKNYSHTSPTMLYLCHVFHGLVCLHLHSSFSFNYVIMLLRHCFLSRLWSAFCHFFIYLFLDFK